MNEYSRRFDELHQFFAGYFHQDWSRVYDWKNESPHFSAVVLHFKATNPQPIILKVRNQLEDFIQYDLEESVLKKALLDLGCNYHPNSSKENNNNWLKEILNILDDPTKKGIVLKEIE